MQNEENHFWSEVLKYMNEMATLSNEEKIWRCEPILPTNVSVSEGIPDEPSDEAIGQLQQIESLKNADVKEILKLKQLDLYGCGLTTIPDSICLLSNLEKLSLPYNSITELPNTIGMLTNLKSLILYENKLNKMDDEICKLTNLEMLDLSENHLEQVSPNIGNLTKLKEIHLYQNMLNDLPNSFFALTNLQELYIGDNVDLSNDIKGRLRAMNIEELSFARV
jgi:Leucine-rich repeat (LRR) protein